MKIKYKFFWLSLIILFTALFLPVDGKAAGPSLDKLAHFLLFAFVSMNACYYFINDKKAMWLVSIFIATLPFGTEYIQSFIDGRNYDNLDIIADIIGIIAGIISYFLFKNLIRKIYSLLGEVA